MPFPSCSVMLSTSGLIPRNVTVRQMNSSNGILMVHDILVLILGKTNLLKKDKSVSRCVSINPVEA